MNHLKNFIAVVSCIVAFIVVFIVVNGIGNLYVDFLNKQGGVVQSSEIVAYRYIVPFVLALGAAIGVIIYYDKKGGAE